MVSLVDRRVSTMEENRASVVEDNKVLDTLGFHIVKNPDQTCLKQRRE